MLITLFRKTLIQTSTGKQSSNYCRQMTKKKIKMKILIIFNSLIVTFHGFLDEIK